MIYDVQPEERYDTGKYNIENGEISWDDWRDQRDWNTDNNYFCMEEAKFILEKMENDADWDPGKCLWHLTFS
jgi:hypothetical protein